VPGSVLAERLTGHLVREIMPRGSRGGPLTPLADQLNHDLTHLQARRVEVQGQRVEGCSPGWPKRYGVHWPGRVARGSGRAAAR
jgi:hypothetical protein